MAVSLQQLYLGQNQLKHAPPCLSSLLTLQYLDLSNNPNILALPLEMGRLKSLMVLKLNGLKDLTDPPRALHDNARDCIRYLNNKLRSAKKLYRMKLMLIGNQNKGKTTLVARLKGLNIGQTQSTVGIDVSNWSYSEGITKKRYHFSIWDFGGQEEYYVTHQCFLSDHSIYLLLFNVKEGVAGMKDLESWLDNIALRAPLSCVIMVGTHLDEVADDEREEMKAFLYKVIQLAQRYTNAKKLIIPEVLPVGLVNRLENIALLREIIYQQATVYKGRHRSPVMGQEIPASYFYLNKELERLQEEVRKGNQEPVMHEEQFKDFVHGLNLTDLNSFEELGTAVKLLHNVGTILHYKDRTHNLNELYFIDPRWLCDMMAKVITIREKNPFVHSGILLSKHIPFIFRDSKFPIKYLGQYLALLDRFEIALPLDNRRILIPSMLPDDKPEEATIPDTPEQPFYHRYITFATPTPPGFWSRLISRIMHLVPQVCKALDVLAEAAEHSEATEAQKPLPSDDNEVADGSKVSAPISEEVQSFLLPNIQRFVVNADEPIAKVDDFRLCFWKTGIVYKGPSLTFCVESLEKSQKQRRSHKGVLIMVSPTTRGTETLCLLIDLVANLIQDWYPGLDDRAGVQQLAPCYECLKLNRSRPFEFSVDQHKASINLVDSLDLKCEYNRHRPDENHSVRLSIVMPDLLFKDIDSQFILEHTELEFQENTSHLLGQGAFGKVYRGRYRGRSVAIKTYSKATEVAFRELQKEVKVLQRVRHPCLVCLVGITLNPIMTLVLEEAPMGSLNSHLKKATPIPRVVMFRMAAEIAAALRFLHSRGIIFRDLKASNVLLWSVDENALCHCKVADFGIVGYLSPLGILGMQGTKGFIAPEVLFTGLSKSMYSYKADIFSFGMLLYQIITRRNPFHNINGKAIDPKIIAGDRPTIVDVPVAETGYFYLTRVMEKCWVAKPEDRPSTDKLITCLSNVTLQSIMAIKPVRDRFSLRHGCAAVTVEDSGQSRGELWICCDQFKGTEVSKYDVKTMNRLSTGAIIKDNQVRCVCICGSNIWICTRSGVECGTISIFDCVSHELVHTIHLDRYNISVTCITCSEDAVYVGTHEGSCYMFNIDLQGVKKSTPTYCRVVTEPIDGIAFTEKHIWVSHACYMSFLATDTLTVESTVSLSDKEDMVGSLALSHDQTIVWSAFMGGVTLSSWHAEQETLSYSINTCQVLYGQIGIDVPIREIVMTCFTPAIDCAWVGMATGHIMLFHEKEVITYIRPYREYVRFLVPIPCEGPCQTEKCMVVSGAKGFQSPIDDLPVELPQNELKQTNSSDGVMILWEAHSGAKLRQMKAVEECHNCYDSYSTVEEVICTQNFSDPTGVTMQDRTVLVVEESSESFEFTCTSIDSNDDMTSDHSSLAHPSLLMPDISDQVEESQECASAPELFFTRETLCFTESYEVLEVEVKEGLMVRISCEKPVMLAKVLEGIAREANEDITDYFLGYREKDLQIVTLETEKDFCDYLSLLSKPQLLLTSKV